MGRWLPISTRGICYTYHILFIESPGQETLPWESVSATARLRTALATGPESRPHPTKKVSLGKKFGSWWNLETCVLGSRRADDQNASGYLQCKQSIWIFLSEMKLRWKMFRNRPIPVEINWKSAHKYSSLRWTIIKTNILGTCPKIVTSGKTSLKRSGRTNISSSSYIRTVPTYLTLSFIL